MTYATQARQQDQPQAEHDVPRVPELQGSVDDRLHLKQLADAVEEKKEHGKPAESQAGPPLQF